MILKLDIVFIYIQFLSYYNTKKKVSELLKCSTEKLIKDIDVVVNSYNNIDESLILSSIINVGKSLKYDLTSSYPNDDKYLLLFEKNIKKLVPLAKAILELEKDFE